MCSILDKFNANWEAEEFEKRTPLFYALKSKEIILFLFNKHVNFNKPD